MIIKIIVIFLKALWGKLVWCRTLHANPQAECFLFLYNSKDNMEVTMTALNSLDELIKRRNYSNVVVICSKGLEDVELPGKIISHSISEGSLKALMDYYSLCDISENVIFCDFTHIKGRDGMEMLGVKGITLEQIVKKGLLDI